MSFFICATDEKKEEFSELLKELVENELVSTDLDREGAIALIIGGDGSLNYFINKYKDKNIEKKKIIYIPAGTANDFAKSLKIVNTPNNLNQIKDIVRSSINTKIPLMKCNDKLFINSASFGSPANITKSGDDLIKKYAGKLSYYLSAFGELVNNQDYQVSFKLDNGKVKESYLKGFLVSQGSFLGGGVKSTVSFSPNFGKFANLVYCDSSMLGETLNSVINLQRENVNDDESKLMSYFFKKLEVSSTTLMPAKIDGELISSKSFVIEKTNKYLNFLLY